VNGRDAGDGNALLPCLTLGIMGIITPYGTGPSPVYFGSGYLPTVNFWK
jgi:L-tartrate/succinate antiporter